MPRRQIERATNFIIEDESWTVIEYDHTSVPGIIYLSLTEGKVNLIYDDLQENIADTDKIAQYELLIPEQMQTFVVGQEIKPIFTVTKNGTPLEAEVNLFSTNKLFAKEIDGILTARKVGEVSIIIQLKDNPKICKKIKIQIIDEQIENFAAYIDGPATIMLDREKKYKLVGNAELQDAVKFSINSQLASITSSQSDSCVIKTNNKNELGTFVLTATYDGKDYTKEITIIPIW